MSVTLLADRTTEMLTESSSHASLNEQGQEPLGCTASIRRTRHFILSSNSALCVAAKMPGQTGDEIAQAHRLLETLVRQTVVKLKRWTAFHRSQQR